MYGYEPMSPERLRWWIGIFQEILERLKKLGPKYRWLCDDCRQEILELMKKLNQP